MPWPPQVPLVFERRSCGSGAKGQRRYDWALAEVTWPGGADRRPPPRLSTCCWSAARSADPTQIAYFAVHARTGTPIGEIVRVMGLRWSIEDCFETAKSDCGLDHYEVRTWDAWHRHITLSMAALAFLTITATRTTPTPEPRPSCHPDEHRWSTRKGGSPGPLKS